MTLSVKIALSALGHSGVVVIHRQGYAPVVVRDGESADVTLHQDNLVTLVERTEDGREPVIPKIPAINLGDRVRIVCSSETGIVVGHSEYIDAEDAYWIRYVDATGRAALAWWGKSAILPA